LKTNDVLTLFWSIQYWSYLLFITKQNISQLDISIADYIAALQSRVKGMRAARGPETLTPGSVSG
jgi:hypothetical protein